VDYHVTQGSPAPGHHGMIRKAIWLSDNEPIAGVPPALTKSGRSK